ncbi:hypothetical protein [Streptomyces syringium]|uniref:hypothetical protein n=1 Tax=Streptomyces syringium TaxID=76729 RepID=UPI0037CD7CDD
MRPTAAALCAALLITLTGCTKTSPAPAATEAAPAATLSHAQVTKQCIDAVAARPAEPSSGEVPSEPTPAPCAPLTDGEYLDAYLRGIRQANEAGRDELQRQLDEARRNHVQ